MGKVVFICFCTVAFFSVLLIDYNQQRGMNEGPFGPTEYFSTVKQRIGIAEPAGQEIQPAEGETTPTTDPATRSVPAGQLKQAVTESSASRSLLGMLGARGDSGPADELAAETAAEAEPPPPITINRPSKKKTSGCGGGTFCGVSN